MNKPLRYHLFWSNASPLVCLSGAALLIMASDRLAHALIAAGALIWVYCLASLIAFAGAKFFPKQGKTIVFSFLSSCFTAFYLLLLWILSPICAMEMFFIISLIPIFCIGSDAFKALHTFNREQTFKHSFFEALVLGTLIIILSFIREPLGFSSLSLPGGAQGTILIFSFDTKSFLPVCLVTTSCGAFLIFGYFLGLYRYFRAKYAPQEDME